MRTMPKKGYSRAWRKLYQARWGRKFAEKPRGRFSEPTSHPPKLKLKAVTAKTSDRKVLGVKTNGFTPGWGQWEKAVTFESKSTPGKIYTVKVWRDGRVTCDCPAWIFSKAPSFAERECPHTRAVKEKQR